MSPTLRSFYVPGPLAYLWLLALASSLWALPAWQVWSGETGGNQIKVLSHIPYRSPEGISEYQKERCQLDLYLPQAQSPFATLVWLHGGGLTAGTKDDEFTVKIARRLAESGVAVAAANYRLSPKATYPSYIEDAAAAFAWVRQNIAQHGGSPTKVFLGGHSAGGYLSFMVGLDGRYLRRHGLETGAIAGLIPVSGQVMTHYTVREERGLNKDVIIADEAAPIHYAAKTTPPILVLYADRDLPARVEENQYLVAALKAAGNDRVRQQQIHQRDHGSIAGNMAQPGDPAADAVLAFMKSVSKAN